MSTFRVYRQLLAHKSIGPVITELVRFIDEEVYPPGFKFKLLTPTDKPIQRIKQEEENVRSIQSPPLPSLAVTPVIEGLTEQWQKPWNSSMLAPRLGSSMSYPIFRTEDYVVRYVTRRVTGRMDFNIVTSSYMEANDIMMAFYDRMYGLNKWLYVKEVNLFFIIPEEVVFYTEDGGRIVVDWSDTRLSRQFIRSINTNKYLYTLKHHPSIRLTSIADASNFYGGADTLPTYGLSGSIEFEIEIPVYITLETDYLVKEIKLQLGLGTLYFPESVYNYLHYREFVRENKIFYPRFRFSYEFLQDELSGFTLTLPYDYVPDEQLYIFFTTRGELYEGHEFEYLNSNTVKFNVGFRAGEVLEYIYCDVHNI